MKCLISWWHLSFGEKIENTQMCMSMVQCKTALPPLLTHWKFSSFVLSHWCNFFAQNPFLDKCLYIFKQLFNLYWNLNQTIMVLLRNTHTKMSLKRQPRHVCCLCDGHFTNAWHGTTPCKTIDIGMQFLHGESFCTPVISLEERQNYMTSYSIKGRARTITGSYWFVTPMKHINHNYA